MRGTIQRMTALMSDALRILALGWIIMQQMEKAGFLRPFRSRSLLKLENPAHQSPGRTDTFSLSSMIAPQ
jgi:hypothetical protein